MKARQPVAGSRQRATGKGKAARPRAGKTTGATARGTLKPMTVSMGFREFVLDQLGGLSARTGEAAAHQLGIQPGPGDHRLTPRPR